MFRLRSGMVRRSKSAHLPPADAAGRVEMRVAGVLVEADWSLRGDRLTIVSPVGQFHAATRDPLKGSVEDQARGMIVELWLALRARSSGLF